MPPLIIALFGTAHVVFYQNLDLILLYYITIQLFRTAASIHLYGISAVLMLCFIISKHKKTKCKIRYSMTLHMLKVKMIAVLSALKVILNMKFETDYETNGKGCVTYLFQNHARAVYSDQASSIS